MKKALFFFLALSFFSLKTFVSPAYATNVKYGGMVVGYNHCEDYGKVGAVWGHTYDTHPPICPGIEAIPVFDLPSNAEDALGGNSRWIIGYNEPDRRGETAHAGAVAWHRIEERFPDKLLVAPGVVGGDPLNWLTPWRNEYISLYGKPPRIDALNLHCYFYTAPLCLDILNGMKIQAQQWGVKEIWVTEFGAPYSDCKSPAQIAEVKKFVDALNSDPMVTRYAWYQNRIRGDEPWIPSNWCNLGLFDFTTGGITSFGNTYKTLIPDPLPVGSYDADYWTAGCTVSGWTCDPSNYGASVPVNVYVDGTTPANLVVISATAITVHSPADPGPNNQCNGTAHDFFISDNDVRQALIDKGLDPNVQHKYRPLALNIDGSGNTRAQDADGNWLTTWLNKYISDTATCVVPPTPINISDLRHLLQNFTNIFDYNILVGNFGKTK